jgi:CheY-like chemotaxis protein
MTFESAPPIMLVVEDEWIICSTIANYMRAHGWEVLEASSGEEAFSYLKDNMSPVSVLFTDIRLGGQLNGWDVADAYRASNPDIGVIYASGNVIEPDRVVAQGTFFPKPYAMEKILEASLAHVHEREKITDDMVCLQPSKPGNGEQKPDA